ncbi:MAG: hypothetical protein FJY65_10165 [Calditrichaeota bacterium]|nr:hypothetical protein [Calditrichota bacterium]
MSTPSVFEASLTDRQRELVSKLADRIVRLRMTTPAILFLESVRPLNYVGSQVMVFFAPVVRGFFGMPEWDEFRLILEHRESIGYLCDQIEAREAVQMEEEARQKAERKAAKAAAKTSKSK